MLCLLLPFLIFIPIPQHFLMNSSGLLQPFHLSSVPCKGYTIFVVGCSYLWEHTAPGRIPFHGIESCMECFHILLESQAVGTMVCPQCGTQRIVHLHRQCPQVLALCVEKHATITCRCGLSFRPVLTCGVIHTKPCKGRVHILPINSRRRRYVHEGTD